MFFQLVQRTRKTLGRFSMFCVFVWHLKQFQPPCHFNINDRGCQICGGEDNGINNYVQKVEGCGQVKTFASQIATIFDNSYLSQPSLKANLYLR